MTSDRFARVYQKPADKQTLCLRCEFQFSGQQSRNLGVKWALGAHSLESAFLGALQATKDEVLESYFAFAADGRQPLLPRTVKQEPKTKRWLMDTVLPSFARYINQHDADGQVQAAYEQILRMNRLNDE
jgi:hypothetical protein